MVFITQINVKKIILTLIVGMQLCASNKDDDIPYINYTKEIMNSFIKNSEQAYDLNCIGTGGKFAKNVAQINIQFLAYRKGTIEEARTLEVKMIEKLLQTVNEHEKIRPFLLNYPFKSEDLHISIGFRNEKDDYFYDDSIAYVSHIKNKLFYDTANPKTHKLLDFMEEPYDEAVKIVNRVK
jgi:hypothetical protein